MVATDEAIPIIDVGVKRIEGRVVNLIARRKAHAPTLIQSIPSKRIASLTKRILVHSPLHVETYLTWVVRRIAVKRVALRIVIEALRLLWRRPWHWHLLHGDRHGGRRRGVYDGWTGRNHRSRHSWHHCGHHHLRSHSVEGKTSHGVISSKPAIRSSGCIGILSIAHNWLWLEEGYALLEGIRHLSMLHSILVHKLCPLRICHHLLCEFFLLLLAELLNILLLSLHVLFVVLKSICLGIRVESVILTRHYDAIVVKNGRLECVVSHTCS